jgi:hypothetical protein
MKMNVTSKMLNRASKDWSSYAGETVKVEQIGSALYAFGSELGCRRIADKMKSGRASFSKNLGTWFYCQELRFT